MGSLERSKKRVQSWKRATVHFLLCFVTGFFVGFAPTTKSTIFSNPAAESSSNRSEYFSPRDRSLVVSNLQERIPNGNFPINGTSPGETAPSSSAAAVPSTSDNDDERRGRSEDDGEEIFIDEEDGIPRRLVVAVTPTSSRDRFRGVMLRRLAATLRLVRPPLLWVVVEQQSDSEEVSEILRRTGIMFRHLVSRENFTTAQAEMDHQMNVALNHIEQHRLSGIVHFAWLSNVYDLTFFEQIREIEVFGTWPMAFLTANRKKVRMEGPVCESSEVKGWHLERPNNQTDILSPIHTSAFAFNSSILWDPERWGRPSSIQHTTQDPLKFVKEEVFKEETKLKGIPSSSSTTEGCSQILLWNVRIPRLGLKSPTPPSSPLRITS